MKDPEILLLKNWIKNTLGRSSLLCSFFITLSESRYLCISQIELHKCWWVGDMEELEVSRRSIKQIDWENLYLPSFQFLLNPYDASAIQTGHAHWVGGVQYSLFPVNHSGYLWAQVCGIGVCDVAMWYSISISTKRFGWLVSCVPEKALLRSKI